MKKIQISVKTLLVATAFFGASSIATAQNVGINASGATPDASAALDVSASDKGMLVPRVALTATTDVATITTPATSLLVYNTATVSDVTPGYYYFDGALWVRIVSGSIVGTDNQNLTSASLSGTTLTVAIEGGSPVSVNLATLQDGTGTDDQNLTSATLSGTNLTINIENGNPVTVDLSALMDGTGTDSQTLSLSGSTLSISGGNNVTLTDNVNDADADATNELQTISKSGSTVTLSNGGGSFTDDDTQLTEAQVDAFAANNGYLTSFTEVDGSVTNEIQSLSISGSTVSLSSGGGSVTVPSSADNLGNHTASQNVDLATSKLVGNGGSTGILIQSDGHTRVEHLPSYNPLTDTLYVVSDASGNLHETSLQELATSLGIGSIPTYNTSCGVYVDNNPIVHGGFTYKEVINPSTCEIWLDRNLGASQVATSSTDAAAYGDLYQWGRPTDGHQLRTSSITGANATTDTPGHGDFITESNSPSDWRVPQNDNLWQGASGVNKPCPSGYRVPTEAELNAERLSWNTNDATGAFGSPLKFPVAGHRNSFGELDLVGARGYYWSSKVSGAGTRRLAFGSSYAIMYSNYRASGFSVRCIKD